MFECEFCKKQCKSNVSKNQHSIRCNLNPNRIPISRGNSGKIGKNQFTNSNATVSDETKLKLSHAGKGRIHSDETKRKISKARIEFLLQNPDKVPYIVNHSSKPSYPEKYFGLIFDHTNVVSQHRVNRYSLDFANVSEKRYLEIDGEQHYNDARIVEHDKIRCAKLQSLGWIGYRLRWSDYQKLLNDQKESVVCEIKAFMKVCYPAP